MSFTRAIATLCVLLGAVSEVDAQTSSGAIPAPSQPTIMVAAAGETQEMVLRDGTRAYGRVDRVDGGTVTFRTTAGALIEVPVSEVISVGVVAGQLVNGEFRPADPNPTRLFFAPTGRSLKRGEAYVGVYQILMPFVQVGVTDRISFGGGTPLVFFGEESGRPFWITPKLQIVSAQNTHASVGVMHFLNVGDGSFGIAYGVVTRGDSDSAFTGGIGYAYERYEDNDGSVVGMIGGEHRVRRNLKLITENYVLSGGGIATGGVRFLGERFATDLALAVFVGGDSIMAFPLVNFVWNFARR